MHKVILLQGIDTAVGASAPRNWASRLEGLWEQQSSLPFGVQQWAWSGLYSNWVWGVFTWFPFYRRKLNQSVLDSLGEIEKWCANFSTSEGKLSVIAHSYAGSIIQSALEQGWHFHKLILLATTMDENFDWWKYQTQFEVVHVYWSPADDITGHSTYGQQGRFGSLVHHPRVLNHRVEKRKHFEWINPENLVENSKEWMEILK